MELMDGGKTFYVKLMMRDESGTDGEVSEASILLHSR